jgi:glycosyltransferase involved in cell wall biosynthesis
MKLVQVIQPLVPHYRVPFFRRVRARKRFEIKVCASRTFPGEHSLKSADPPEVFVDLSYRCTSLLGGSLFWQHGLKLDDRLGRGDVLVLGQIRFLNTLPLMLSAKLRGAKIVWWGQGWSATSRPWSAAIRRSLMRLADVVLLYTDREAEEFVRRGFSRRRVFALNNTIDTSEIDAIRELWDSERKAQFACAQGISGKKLMLFCGRLHAKARVDLALDALAMLRAYDKRWVLAVIGTGEQLGNLKEYAVAKGLQESVLWLGEIYGAAAQGPWFLSAQCFVYPGSVGLSLLNSLAFGLPVITHDDLNIQMPEIAALVDGENGALFKANDADDLARKILEVVSDPVARERMSLNAIETTADRFNMQHMVDQFIAAIEAAHANPVS